MEIKNKALRVILVIISALFKFAIRVLKNIFIILTTPEKDRDEALRMSYEKEQARKANKS